MLPSLTCPSDVPQTRNIILPGHGNHLATSSQETDNVAPPPDRSLIDQVEAAALRGLPA